METNNRSWKNNYIQMNVEDLNLDLENPRTDTGKKISYDELIKQLWFENIFELIEGISNKGYAASSILMVIEEKTKNVVIDGNRRLLSVKMLHKPDDFKKFVPDIITVKDFERVVEFSINKKEDISLLTGIMYPGRLEAEQEMSILHLDGESVRKWEPLRQYRYFERQLKNNKISISKLSTLIGISAQRIKKGVITIQLFNLAKNSIDLGEKLNKTIYDDHNFRTDKFQKTVVNEEGERFLGYSLSKSNGKIIIKNNKLFLERLELILQEIYDSSSKFFKSAQYPTKNRSEFFKTIESGFLNSDDYKKNSTNEKKDQEANQEDDISIEEGVYSGVYDGQQKQNKGSILSGIRGLPNVESDKIKSIFKELKDIDVHKSPMITAVSIRILLEITTKELLKLDGKYSGGTLKERMLRVSREIGNKDKERENLILAMTSDFLTKKFNEVVHNTIFQMSEPEVSKIWINLKVFFEFMILQISIIEKKDI